MANMAVEYAPNDYTGYTDEQQIEFRRLLDEKMLLLDSINGIELPHDMPLLWVPVLREAQLMPGYDPSADAVYLLSRHPPAQWQLVLGGLLQLWEQRHQQQLLAGLGVAQWTQHSQLHGPHPAADQPQQGVENEHHEKVGIEQYRALAEWLYSRGMPYDQQPEAMDLVEISAAATQAAAEQTQCEERFKRQDSGVDVSDSNDAPDTCQTATEPAEPYWPSTDLHLDWQGFFNDSAAWERGLRAE
jgi:hypothetical protein